MEVILRLGVMMILIWSASVMMMMKEVEGAGRGRGRGRGRIRSRTPTQTQTQTQTQTPCLFVFGDSLSDNGNNNYLRTSARVNYRPYGIDSPGQVPSGRFSNGLNLIDVIAGHLGFQQPIPPYAWSHRMNTRMLLRGVNYASGSAGIRKETGQHLGERVPLDDQLANHKKVISMISRELGGGRGHLQKCLYTINIGSNDYLNNYYVPDKYPTSKQYTRKEYTHVLLTQYAAQIMTLHAMGARKVAVFSQGELGCIPQTMNMIMNKGLGDLCYNEMNEASRLFNHNLRVLVDKLNRKVRGANFTCINVDVISPTAAVGFVEWAKPCCQVRWDGQCQEGVPPCQDRDHYIFFDNFHPTQAMNIRVGALAYSASTREQVHPVDIRTLMRT